jgi:hypothetical protein
MTPLALAGVRMHLSADQEDVSLNLRGLWIYTTRRDTAKRLQKDAAI